MKTSPASKFPASLLAAGLLLAAVLPSGAAPIFDRSDAAHIEAADSPGAKINIFSMHKAVRGARQYYTDLRFGPKEKFPEWLEGLLFYEMDSRQSHTYRCVRDGKVLALAPVNSRIDLTAEMAALSFTRLKQKPFQLYGKSPLRIVAPFVASLRSGDILTLPPGVILAGFDGPRSQPSGAGEILYNGIRLPDRWPPRMDWESDEPPPEAPWLKNRPSVIPIDTGRQLLVDDFLVETTDLRREFHYPEKFHGNPVLKPETEIELHGNGDLAAAVPKSGGLWWDPEKQLFELWYEAGWVSTVAYATSRDGIHWTRPDLPLRPGTNQVLPSEIKPDSWSVVRDYDTADPRKKFKIFLRSPGGPMRANYFTSPDGIDWGAPREGGITGDRSTVYYNPFRKKWVYSLRWTNSGDGADWMRLRAYWEADDFERGMNWLPDDPVPWARADKLDLPDPRVGDKTQLYNIDAVAYESLMLGMFEIHYGPLNSVNARKGIPKFTGLNFAYSRDGFHWHRPDRKMAINSEFDAGHWDRGYVQSLNNICVIRGDKLWFYYSAFAGDETRRLGENGIKTNMESGLYGNGATGVAVLRRDGFASLNATAGGGVLLTRPVTFSGAHLFVNADAPRGALLVEICDETGNAIAPFTFANCIPFTGDSTLAPISWKGEPKGGLSALAGKPVRFRFKLTDGKLYSFWVSRDATGRSDGYVAGGGPGYTGPTDTVGAGALEAESKLSGKP